MREATEGGRGLGLDDKVSIRASREGGDRECLVQYGTPEVSIRASREGGDLLSLPRSS